MAINISVKQAQKHIENMTRDLGTRLAALEIQVDEARKSNHPAILDQLYAKQEQFQKTYQIGLEWANQALETAKVNEAQEAQAAEARRQFKEDQLKAKVQQTWNRAGGDPLEFEAAWPTLRATILTEKVTKTMLTEPVEKPIIL